MPTGGKRSDSIMFVYSGPCKKFTPTYKEAAPQLKALGYVVGEVNIDKSAGILKKYGYTGIPKIAAFV